VKESADDRAGGRGDGRETTIGAVLPAPLEPSIRHDFADPTVLSVGGIYYAYSTASRYGSTIFHVPVQTSTSLSGGFSHARW
jgi:hypothetical protein